MVSQSQYLAICEGGPTSPTGTEIANWYAARADLAEELGDNSLMVFCREKENWYRQYREITIFFLFIKASTELGPINFPLRMTEGTIETAVYLEMEGRGITSFGDWTYSYITPYEYERLS